MIRRPATIVSLGDYEVQCFLRQILLRTLPADLDQLRLDESYGGDSLDESSDDRSASFGSASEFDFNSMLDSIPASSCLGISSRIQGDTVAMTSTASPTAAMTASRHRTIDLSEASATTSAQISTALPRRRASQHCGQQFEKRSISPRNERRKENDPRSSTEPKREPSDTKRCSLPQAYGSSLETFPELTFSTVQPRALPTPATESDKTVLISAVDSPTTVMDSDWEFGSAQPDSIFEESCADTLHK